MVRGLLGWIIGHKQNLRRAGVFHQLQEALIGVAFQTQLFTVQLLTHHFGEVVNIRAADVALVRARVHGDAFGSCFEGER